MSGNLSVGGSAKGDISDTPGETDTINVNLVAGSRLNVTWKSGFAADVALLAPDGSAVTTGLSGVTKGSAKALTATQTGTYRFEIRSSDGAQGGYSLNATPYWDKTVVFEGTGEATFDVPMPATGSLKGKVQPLPGASNPSILALRTPDGADLLTAPIVGSPGVAKLKPLNVGAAGTYRLTATATAGTLGFRATLKRSAPRMSKTKIDLTNGLTQVSFAASGLDSYFRGKCANCHSWAENYAGVRAYARASLPRMKSGNMPQGGPRTDAETLARLSAWMDSGYAK
jgi:hypothetical protein